MRKVAKRFPRADLSGVDPAPGMVEAARKAWRGDRPARFVQAAAEHLPFEGGEFDLVTSTVSFHHWQDQQAGLNEIGRVLAPGDLWSWPTSSPSLGCRCGSLCSGCATGSTIRPRSNGCFGRPASLLAASRPSSPSSGFQQSRRSGRRDSATNLLSLLPRGRAHDRQGSLGQLGALRPHEPKDRGLAVTQDHLLKEGGYTLPVADRELLTRE